MPLVTSEDYTNTIITLLTRERSGAVIHVIRVERALTGSNALFGAGSNGFML